VQLFDLLDGWRERLRTTPPAQTRTFVEDYVKATGLPAMIRSSEKNANVARAKVRMLAELVAGVDAHVGDSARARLTSWIDAVSLDPKGSSDDDDEGRGRVTLMTLHSSKGLEFDVVFMVGMNDGQLPHVRALDEPGGVDEERRLCYVGMTRARQALILTRARHVLKRNAKEPLKPSRFLADIPDHLVRNYRSTDETLTEEKQRELNAQFLAKIRRDLVDGDLSDQPIAEDTE
jgi:superfamily I DNA/RNA helicase